MKTNYYYHIFLSIFIYNISGLVNINLSCHFKIILMFIFINLMEKNCFKSISYLLTYKIKYAGSWKLNICFLSFRLKNKQRFSKQKIETFLYSLLSFDFQN